MPAIDPALRSDRPFADSFAPSNRERRASLTTLLDRAIRILMIAILVTLSWPISVVLWHQSRPALPAVRQEVRDAP